MFKRILVPVDGSETATKALVAALQLARDSGGQVRVIHSLDEMAYMTSFESSVNLMEMARETASKILDDAMQVAAGSGVPADWRLLEEPGRRLGDVVAEHALAWQADLVVVGTHGRRGLGRVLLGSGSEQVIRAAHVPVLVVR